MPLTDAERAQIHESTDRNRAVMEWQTRATLEDGRALLGDRPLDAELLGQLIASTHHAIDRNSETFLAHHAGELRIGCRVGCASCCHTPVQVTTSELAYLAAALHAEEWPAVLERAALVVARDGGDRTTRYRRSLACPLLEGGKCGVYPARPGSCRTHFSASRQACLREWNQRTHANPKRKGVPLIGDTKALGTAVQSATDMLLLERGLEIEIVDLVEGLLVILQPGALDRWLAGERVFTGLYQGSQDGGLYSAMLASGMATLGD